MQRPAKASVKKVTRVWAFPRTMPYPDIMRTLRDEFMEKWSDKNPSPHGGLEDHEQLNVLGSGAFGTVVSRDFFIHIITFKKSF